MSLLLCEYNGIIKFVLPVAMKRILYSLSAFLLLGYLVLCPLDAVEASRVGLLLWFHTILPTLLPFIILSNLIIRLDGMHYITFWAAPVLKRLFGISSEACYAVVTGFLCGYPMGAKVAADLTLHGKISREEGNYLLSFCNNISPMFIISYIVSDSLRRPALLMPTLIILYASPILCAQLIRIFKGHKKQATKKEPSQAPQTASAPYEITFQMIDDSIMNGFETITKLGGYIILFAIISKMAELLPIYPPLLKFALLGSIEVTNGISLLASSGLPAAAIFALVLCAASFGGFSSIAQTQSMIKEAKLSISTYILAKLLNAIITLLLVLIFLVA